MELTHEQKFALMKIELAKWQAITPALHERELSAREAGLEYDFRADYEAEKAAWLSQSNCIELACSYQIWHNFRTTDEHSLLLHEGEMRDSSILGEYNYQDRTLDYCILNKNLHTDLANLVVKCEDSLHVYDAPRDVAQLQSMLNLKKIAVVNLRVSHDSTEPASILTHERCESLFILATDLQNLLDALQRESKRMSIGFVGISPIMAGFENY